MSSNGNFVRMSLGIVKWEWYTDISTKVLFLHLILSVNWQDGNFKGTVVKRGQIITSLQHLAEDTGLSVQQVRTAINKLKSTHEITHESTNHYTMITLCNYEAYNPEGKDINTRSNTRSNKRITNEQQTDNKRITTIEEEEEEIEEEEEKYVLGSREMEMALLLCALMTANNEKTKQPNYQQWCKDIDLLHRVDGNSFDDIEKVIRWTQQDSFEQNNVLSPSKLRKRFANLWMKAKGSNGRNPTDEEIDRVLGITA